VNANSVNMIAFLRDLRKPQELIPKLRKLKKLRTTAGNYLSYKYGILPTIDDLKSIVAAVLKLKPYLDKNGFKTYGAGFTDSYTSSSITTKLEQHIKIAISDEDSAFDAIASKLDSMGFLPTLENVWDLIPYSFVLDWFVDVGDFLHRVDSRLRLVRLNIRYATMSRKETTSYKLIAGPNLPFAGPIDLVRYQRWVTDHCPVPPLSVSTPFSVSDHWLEAGALILSRSKH